MREREGRGRRESERSREGRGRRESERVRERERGKGETRE